MIPTSGRAQKRTLSDNTILIIMTASLPAIWKSAPEWRGHSRQYVYSTEIFPTRVE